LNGLGNELSSRKKSLRVYVLRVSFVELQKVLRKGVAYRISDDGIAGTTITDLGSRTLKKQIFSA